MDRTETIAEIDSVRESVSDVYESIQVELNDVKEALSCVYESIHSINDRMDVISERVDFAMGAINDLRHTKANREVRCMI